MKYNPYEVNWESVVILDKDNQEQGPTEYVQERVQRQQAAAVATASRNRSSSPKKVPVPTPNRAGSNRAPAGRTGANMLG